MCKDSIFSVNKCVNVDQEAGMATNVGKNIVQCKPCTAVNKCVVFAVSGMCVFKHYDKFSLEIEWNCDCGGVSQIWLPQEEKYTCGKRGRGVIIYIIRCN